MTEDLVQSTSSQRSNPRGLRRVRPVPYECCGGMCSFLNSGCFTLCCNGRKTRRRSSVYVPKDVRKKEGEEIKREDDPGQLSETTKRLIKPNSQDGLTEDDLYVFERVFEADSDESPRKQLYVTPFDVELEEHTPKKEVEHSSPEKADKEEDTSVLTDDTSASGGDGSAVKKKKKKILSILKIKKSKRKNKDGVSVTSSTNSLACSEISEDLRKEENLEVESIIVERVEDSPSKTDEVSHVETESGKVKENNPPRRFLAMFSSMRVKRGKKKDDTNGPIPHETKDDSEVLEERISKHAKIIPLGSGVPPQTKKSAPETKEIQEELEINIQKKPFWKALSKKDKNTEKSVPDKEIIDGIKPDSTQTNKQDLVNEVKIEIGTDASDTCSSNAPKEVSQNVEIKKKTFFGTLKSNKKDEQSSKKPNDMQKSSQIPCLLSACVNSDIKPEGDRKNSSDSIEVKTIADEELEGDGQTIRIVRNQFFPAEVHSVGDQHDPSSTGKVHEVNVEGNVSEEHIGGEEVAEGNTSEGMRKDIDELKETDEVLAKKYGVFEKEDFSESLHTLVDEADHDYILLAPASAISTPVVGTFGEEKIKEKKELKDEDVDLPEGVFRTSCRLSINGSERYLQESNEMPVGEKQELNPEETQEEANEGKINNQKESLAEKTIDTAQLQQKQVLGSQVSEIPAENVMSSNDTLTGSRSSMNIIEKSTETLKNHDESSSSWIEVANVEDLDESKFNYIYKNTLKKVQNGEASLGKDRVKEEVTEELPLANANEVAAEEIQSKPNSEQLENSCEKCRKNSIEEDAKGNQEDTKCVCTTLTKPRQSLTDIEEGSVKSKVAAFNKSKHPIIVPINSVGILNKDDVTISEAHSSPTLGSKSKSATPSPIAAKSRSGTLSSTNSEWQTAEEDMDRMIQGRGSLSGLGLRSDSMASVYSGAGEGRYGTVAVKGQVEFGLQYNYKAGALEIHVKQCKDLAPVDTKRNRSDPYVKVYLLPDKSKSGKRKTKVKKHTLNPVFDETLKFHISLNGLETRTLWLTVWHSDMFGRNDFLGEVMMALENKVFDDPAPVWYNLQERTEPFDDTISFKGDIIVCLKFVPPDMTVQKKGKRSRGTLHVLVKEAKYLTAYKANGTSDPFCKSYLLPDKGRNSKQKTPVVKKTVNPVWNHTFIYEDVTLQELAERSLELTLWDHDRLASNEFLGGVRFSLGTGKHYGKPVEWMDATGKELTLWKSMLERPNFWVEGCLSLRPSLDSRIS